MTLGIADITPSTPVVVDSTGTWMIRYVVGEAGIPRYGGIRVFIPPGWTMPQLDDAKAQGYTLVDIRTDENVKWKTYLYSGRWIAVEVQQGQLHPGDSIIVVYGDRSKGGPGSEAPRVPVPAAEFTVWVDTEGYYNYRKLPESPRIKVTEGKVVRFNVVAPSLAVVGQNVRVGITAVDARENWVRNYSTEVVAFCESHDGACLGCYSTQTAQLHHQGKRTLRQAPCKLENGLGMASCVLVDQGVQRVRVRESNGPIDGVSNPVKILSSAPEFQLYWGDIHGHSSYSDGRFPPEEYFAYARDISRLDFCALTDHDNVGSNSNVEEHSKLLSPEEWREIKRIANAFNEAGRFTTLIGYEYTNIEIEVGGHRNVYFESDDPPIFPSWAPTTNTPTKLFDALRSLGERVLVIPHHSLRFMGWEHAPEFQRLFEVYSMWGTSEKPDDDCAFSHPVKYHHGGVSFREGLARGYRWGVTAGGDNHDSLPGIRQGTDIWRKGKMAQKPGLVAVYAAENSRKAIFDALWNRRCYGTTGSRIVLDFRLNGAWMGSELMVEDRKAERCFEVEVLGEAPIKRVAIMKNGAEVFSRDVREWELRFTWVDKEPVNGLDYYYVAVEEEDGARAWSSPIWVEAL